MTAMHSVKDGLIQFSMNMYDKIVAKQEANLENTIFSPVSIYSALLLALAGSSGSTLQEMLQILKVPIDLQSGDPHQTIGRMISDYFKGSKEVELRLANRLFLIQPIQLLNEYLQLIGKHYNATAELLDKFPDMESKRKHINQWVAEVTRDKIPDLLPSGSIDQSTVLALVNALYFRGFWVNQFNKAATHDADFKLLDGSVIQVKTMYRSGKYELAELSELSSVAFKMPFSGTDWEMLIVLPDEIDGLSKLLTQLRKPGTWTNILSASYYKMELALHLPKFKVGHGQPLDAKQILMECGMNRIFTSEADLSKMSRQGKLLLSEVMHKALIEVDEEGATAAAATAGIMLLTATMPKTVRVDHPFFIALVSDKTAPMFVGHVIKPEYD